MRLVLAMLAAAIGVLAPAAGASAAPTLSIDDVTVTEGHSGQTTAAFTVTASETSATPVTVNYATADGTARQPADYTQTSGLLTIAPGTTSNTILVPVKGDTLDEVAERFEVNLSSASGATIADSAGAGTIDDDDPAPTLSITDASRTEGNVAMSFTARLAAASGRDVTVAYATSDRSARAPGDYAAASGTLTVPAGATTRTVRVAIREDSLDEPSETFAVDLSGASGATISDARGIGTIADDDGAPALTVRDAAAREGQPAGLVVGLSRASGRTITVRFATEARTATAGADFTPAAGTLTIPAGATSGTIFAATVVDAHDEPPETFAVRLSRAANARISDSLATVTIADDDPPPNARPRIARLSIRPFAFRAARLGGPVARRGGALVRLVLSERAVVEFRVQRRGRGGRWAPVAGGFRRSAVAGANRLRFTGRIGGRRLRPGRYRLVAVATDRLGARSFVRRAAFRILP
jgi:Calx-beta domain-containing protein